ncbi:TPA: TIR domain-containing protein [Vibrio parahaemolyticus]|nr:MULTISPECIES: TIR domain-containing protein [Vibrio harveyi group]EGR1906794.1 molecular chaperone Tir [Vibrio parahaemolyticus]EGV1828751.1 molecular chaperone Tir [Vibrio parahaemolyticus]EHU5130263.1 TIR domain-containing protein [Vibrio parahaemolyticus]EJL6387692.1 TIR domain-containing protein [Vibrio parahaemolyticus]MBE4082966.1 TIR domain-containing protein [Vibrio parahaemolyticus]
MPKIPVFYSFHFDNDVMRVQLIRNMGMLDGNSPTNPNTWEQMKRKGSRSIMNWIDNNMKYKRCVVVLIGENTYKRPWVKYEIVKAWSEGKALVGIYIHNLKCPHKGYSKKGHNPFDEITLDNGVKLSSYVKCYEPSQFNAYGDISKNISSWIEHAIKNKRN